jgi:hypothetical protein
MAQAGLETLAPHRSSRTKYEATRSAIQLRDMQPQLQAMK